MLMIEDLTYKTGDHDQASVLLTLYLKRQGASSLYLAEMPAKECEAYHIAI